MNRMSILTDLTANIRQIGRAPYSKCKFCEGTNLIILETSVTPRVFHLPTIPFRSQITATCPLCGTTFTLKKEKAKMIRKNLSTLLLPSDLEKAKPKKPLANKRAK